MSLTFNQLLLQDSTSLKALLFLSLGWIFCFLSRKNLYWFCCLSIYLALAVMANRLSWVGLVFVTITAGVTAAYFLKTEWSRPARAAVTLGLFACGLGLFAHWFPGFNNWQVAAELTKGEGIPFSLWLNFDKPFFGVLFFALSQEAARSRASWLEIFKAVGLALPAAAVVVFAQALALGWVQLAITPLPEWTWIWLWKNLFLTVIAEEALFRGLLLRELKKLLPEKWAGIAVVIAALAFGLAHGAGGLRYVLAASLAGVFYGWAYLRSGGRLEAAILTHLGLNCVHFWFFTYPQ